MTNKKPSKLTAATTLMLLLAPAFVTSQVMHVSLTEHIEDHPVVQSASGEPIL